MGGIVSPLTQILFPSDQTEPTAGTSHRAHRRTGSCGLNHARYLSVTLKNSMCAFLVFVTDYGHTHNTFLQEDTAFYVCYVGHIFMRLPVGLMSGSAVKAANPCDLSLVLKADMVGGPVL